MVYQGFFELGDLPGFLRFVFPAVLKKIRNRIVAGKKSGKYFPAKK